jgi:hypothetical protein
MMRLHFRIRAVKSFADFDPEYIKTKLSGLRGIELNRLIDDRLADGTTLSVIIMITDSSNEVLRLLQNTLTALPKVRVYIMDRDGKESDLSLMNTDEIRGFDINR